MVLGQQSGTLATVDELYECTTKIKNHQAASMRPQMAWKYRQDRERAMKTIGGELPRYADYAERNSSLMERRHPRVDYDNMTPPPDHRVHLSKGNDSYCPMSVPEGQVISPLRDPRRKTEKRPQVGEEMKPRMGWKWCKHCGYDGAKEWRDPSKLPVDTIPMEEGYIIVQPKAGVNFLSDHASRDCPKYKPGAMYPCSKCSHHDRIAFQCPDKCQEDFSGRPPVSISFAARRSTSFSKEPTSAEHPELGAGKKWDDDAFDLLNTA